MEGLAEGRPGVGFLVRTPAGPSLADQDDLREELAVWLRKARAAGLPPEDIAARAESPGRAYRGAGRTERRREVDAAASRRRPPAAGRRRVRVFGKDPRGDTATLADIGFVAQGTPLYRDFTVTDLITMGGKLNRRRHSATEGGREAVRRAARPGGAGFWAFQSIETGTFVALAALLVFLAFRPLQRIA
jgi:hypothetical protein